MRSVRQAHSVFVYVCMCVCVCMSYAPSGIELRFIADIYKGAEVSARVIRWGLNDVGLTITQTRVKLPAPAAP